MPTADKVAVILPGDGTQGGASCKIVLHWRNGLLKQLWDTNPAYPALHYVLLFLFGSHG
jgi:hypothetical protein